MMSQSSSSHPKHENSMPKEGGNYDIGELDQSLFLYFDGHDNPSVDQEHKQTLNIFPSEPMNIEPSTKVDLGLLPSTSNSNSQRYNIEQPMERDNPRAVSSLAGKGKDIKTSLKNEEKNKSIIASSDQEGPKTPDAKTLRRLAQNREAARKSRLRKKAYIQQLENSRIKLLHLEQELQSTRTQGMLISGVNQNLPPNPNGLTSNAVAFNMEYERWKEEHHQMTCELQAAVQENLPESELRAYVDKYLGHYEKMMKLKSVIVKLDVFHIVSGMWVSPAERCFLWIGGFRPSQILKIVSRHIELLSEQQLLGICSLQQSAQETEEALSQGLATLNRSLTETVVSDALSFSSDIAGYMGQMYSVAINKLNNLEAFVIQADNLRQHTIHRLHQILSGRQAALCFLAMEDYFHRLRALSSLWMARPRNF
ncbi:bZIP transcription factor TGA10-like isoform X1 [Asparagus officinalis]|uniref:bZIP transcription factor TGA10-like isoform X1 n=1 Tax=Asparagus officinalis TaxID=4686 RepID=UPI00098E17D1|nr:bZIP transcription factor TGA10-like isoform X1 [Asparagus officinalis]